MSITILRGGGNTTRAVKVPVRGGGPPPHPTDYLSTGQFENNYLSIFFKSQKLSSY